jgi:tetratricopeptide (TPR) repeat protein
VQAWLNNRLHIAVPLLLVHLCGCTHAFRPTVAAVDGLSEVTQQDLFQIGLYQAHRGDLLRAEQYLTAARDGGYSESVATYWLVRVCVSAGRYQSALQHAVRYLRDNPADSRARLVVASIHEALGDVTLAERELQNIVRAEPDWALPRYRLALLYQRTPSRASLALESLAEYLRLEPDGPHSAHARASLEQGVIVRGESKPVGALSEGEVGW